MHNNCIFLYQYVNLTFKRQKFKWTFGIKQSMSGIVDKLSRPITIIAVILPMLFFQKCYVCWYDLIYVCVCMSICIGRKRKVVDLH